ncbi:MAG: hypothetical protein IT373_12755 [Polyangiaceae bacterium]|nr:hypothetical protein [Polyangiaceae bacterium]
MGAGAGVALGLRMLAGVVVATAVGCASLPQPPEVAKTDGAPTTAPTPKAPRAPSWLAGLALSQAQEQAISELRASLAPKLAPFWDAARDFALAIATAAQHGDGRAPALAAAASWAINVGEDVREPVLDAINRVHRILTPAQRASLTERLLGDEKESQSDDSAETPARSLGDVLDLDLGQMLALLVRAQALKGAFEERLGPWRQNLKAALLAFAEDDFDVRRHKIAAVPAVSLATGLVRDAVRVLLPILERDQGRALAAFIREKVAESRLQAPAKP